MFVTNRYPPVSDIRQCRWVGASCEPAAAARRLPNAAATATAAFVCRGRYSYCYTHAGYWQRRLQAAQLVVSRRAARAKHRPSAKPKTCRIRSAKRLRRSITVSITCCTCSTSFCIPSTIGCPSVAVPSDPSRRRPSHRHRSASSSRRRSSARPSPPNNSSNNSTNSSSSTSNRAAGLRAPRAAPRVHRRRRRDCRASARSATCRPCSRPSRRLRTSRPRARPTRRPADRRPAATSRIRTRPRARTIRPRRTSARPPARRPAPRTPRDPRPRKDDPIATYTAGLAHAAHLAPHSRREPREWWKEEAAPPPPTPRYQPLEEEVESTTVDDRVNRPNLPSRAADNGVRRGSVLRSRARDCANPFGLCVGWLLLGLLTQLLCSQAALLYTYFLADISVGNVFGGRCGAEALGLGLMSLNPAYRFALPPGLAAKTTRCLTFDQAARLRRRFFGADAAAAATATTAATATATSRHCWLYIYTETTRRARLSWNVRVLYRPREKNLVARAFDLDRPHGTLSSNLFSIIAPRADQPVNLRFPDPVYGQAVLRENVRCPVHLSIPRQGPRVGTLTYATGPSFTRGERNYTSRGTCHTPHDAARTTIIYPFMLIADDLSKLKGASRSYTRRELLTRRRRWTSRRTRSRREDAQNAGREERFRRAISAVSSSSNSSNTPCCFSSLNPRNPSRTYERQRRERRCRRRTSPEGIAKARYRLQIPADDETLVYCTCARTKSVTRKSSVSTTHTRGPRDLDTK
ncbi:unnamed protein product [Trichogramma brassicae]|uniref:Uncharacterized protein n=1 Tax=Trichogramma brassicae TaxID=86971 RepID=A0A6H5ICE0_9HYME|nr:unnamed protein product [Trichogramma brassicae]